MVVIGLLRMFKISIVSKHAYIILKQYLRVLAEPRAQAVRFKFRL